MYGVTSGDYAGQSLCYECTAQLVASNVAEVAAHKKRTQFELILMGVGAVIGFIVMIGSGFGAGLMGALFGAGAGMILKAIKLLFNDAHGLALIYFIGAPVVAIINLIKRLNQLKQTSEIIESDSRVLAELHDYFAYTQAMEKADDTKGFDALTAEGGELFDNRYAVRVKNAGENAAQADLRRGIVQIAANGEIIRGFDPVKKPKKGKAA